MDEWTLGRHAYLGAFPGDAVSEKVLYFRIILKKTLDNKKG
jgi:hypothetical protein